MGWKPCGNPINLVYFEDGDYVEGYVYEQFNKKPTTIKNGRIYRPRHTPYSYAAVYIEVDNRRKIVIGEVEMLDGTDNIRYFRSSGSRTPVLYDGQGRVAKTKHRSELAKFFRRIWY